MIETQTEAPENMDAVLDFSFGKLSPARSAIVACQSEMSGEVNRDIAIYETIAANLMLEGEAVPLSSGFFSRFNSRMSEQDAAHNVREHDAPTMASARVPNIIEKLCGQSLLDIKWNKPVAGVALYDIMGDRRTKQGERLYLMRVKAGMTMPEHTHTGEEWTLLLQGGYDTDGVTYRAGDLHISDDTVDHSPAVHSGEDCICLVMTEGPIKIKPFLPRLFQPLLGI